MFGDNLFGQAGYVSSVEFASQPGIIEALRSRDVTNIALGDQHSLAVASQTFGSVYGTQSVAGLLFVWGNNFVGQARDGPLLWLTRVARSGGLHTTFYPDYCTHMHSCGRLRLHPNV